MAGVTAQSRAIVSSANTRILVTIISIPRFTDTINAKVSLPTVILDHVALICSDPGHTFSSTIAKMPWSVGTLATGSLGEEPGVKQFR
jgi:hypothetical protein